MSKQAHLTSSLIEWLRLTNVSDLSSNKLHSRDFNGSRSEYIYMRLRLLSLLFALLAIIWIPIDVLFTPNNVLGKILGLRLAYSGLFLTLGLWTPHAQSLTFMRIRLGLFVIIPSIFYVTSRLVLNNQADLQAVLIGYSFLPFLTVVLLAIFPLTLFEGIVFSAISIIAFISTELFIGNMFNLSSLVDLWLLLLLTIISIWAQLSQLHMLLRLYREASRDALTGLVNRAVLNKWIEPEIDRARKNGLHLCAMIIDLDFFKRVNDTYGHLTGDTVLKDFSTLFKQHLAGFNLIARYGGEEFLAILPGKNAQETMRYAEKIRQRCHTRTPKSLNDETVQYTISIGIAQLRDSDTASSLIDRADAGLYEAKMAGRDRAFNTETETSQKKE